MTKHGYTGRRYDDGFYTASCVCGHRTVPAVNAETANKRILAHIDAARKQEAVKLARKRAKVGRKNLAKARAAKKGT